MYIVCFKYYYKAFCSLWTLVIGVIKLAVATHISSRSLSRGITSVHFLLRGILPRPLWETVSYVNVSTYNFRRNNISFIYRTYIRVYIYYILPSLYIYLFIFFFTSCFECWMTFWVDFLNICFQHLNFKCFYFFIDLFSILFSCRFALCRKIYGDIIV